MKAGYSHKTASRLADFLAFRKVWYLVFFFFRLWGKAHLPILHVQLSYLWLAVQVNARLGGRIRLIISGGAPISSEIEEFLRVTSCSHFVQGYGE